jgi:plastocyanin
MRRGTIAGVVMAQWMALTWWGGLAAGAGEVEVRVFQFTPKGADVTVGSVVTWRNQDEIEHTVTSGVPGGGDGKFEAALAGKGATATVRFTEPGVYPYFCSRHQAMRGEVRVQ